MNRVVEYIFALRDQYSGEAQKIAKASNQAKTAIHEMGRALNSIKPPPAIAGWASASEKALWGAQRAALATGKAHQQMAREVAAAQKTAVAVAPKGVMAGGRGNGLGFLGNLSMLTGGFFTGRRILREAREASKADNKFRSLVDSVTDEEMAGLRETIQKQMRYTGESYGELMDAAGDAAQIVGSAGLAKHITAAASSLAKVDTAGKTTSNFAESLAAIVGPDGTMAEVQKLGDMLGKQQRLGAATAGGSIEAFKNVVGFQGIAKFDTAAMLTAIGLIKTIAPALKDGEIGTQALYGTRMLMLPNAADSKKIAAAGFSRKDFTDVAGNFDVQKAHKALYDLANSDGGRDKILQMFSGRNVQAGKFWLTLTQKSPEEFAKYLQELHDSTGTLWDMLKERITGLDGALTKLEGSGKSVAMAIGAFLTPALISIAEAASGAADSIGPALTSFSQAYPVLSQIAGMAALAAAGLITMALPMAAIAFAFRTFGLTGARFATALGFIGRASLGAIAGMAGITAGIAGGAAAWVRMIALAYRYAGVLGAVRIALRGLMLMTGVTAALMIGMEIVENWNSLATALERVYAIVKQLATAGKIETGQGSAYHKLNKQLENSWFGRAAIAFGLVKPVDEIIGAKPGTVSGLASVPPLQRLPMPPPLPKQPAAVKKQSWWDLAFGGEEVERARKIAAGNVRGLRRIPSPDVRFPRGGAPMARSQSPSANLARSEAQRIKVESTIKTTIDPIRIDVPKSIDVNIKGPGVSGQGSIPMKSFAPRGQSIATPGNPVVQN